MKITSDMKKYIYSFEEADKSMKDLLGGKGANLAEMCKIGLPVPDGFTITTEACNQYYANGEKMSDEVKHQIFENLTHLENSTGKKFGDQANPLLISVRSGAKISMPGMMDTVLNLGMNDEVAGGMAMLTGNEPLAYDSYRRFIQMFGDVVLEIPKYRFDKAFEAIKADYQVESDTDIPIVGLKQVIESYKSIVREETGEGFPEDPELQLLMTVQAVFRSWNNARAKVYRQINHIPDEIGTAVTVQSMVFGNMGNNSGTGVAFTRNPSNGENHLFGEFLMNAQGEDVVAGIRTPKPISQLEEEAPDTFQQFLNTANQLEKHFMEMQDIEFTIEKGKLFILQTRTGKRTAHAAVNIAVDMVNEGLIDQETALLRVDPNQVEQILHPIYDDDDLKNATQIAQGLPACPGAATGRIYFSAEDVVDAVLKGENVLLVRAETSPDDIQGMVEAKGILTSRGGMTSHAAVVARGMGKCCVAGCDEIVVDEQNKTLTVGDKVITEGEYLSLNGNTGKVYLGEINPKEVSLSSSFDKLMEWADRHRTLKIRTNADTPHDSEVAVEFGAEGIGLCRTEHMFFDEERIPSVQEMIVANDPEKREAALEKLYPFQKGDFKEIFKAMDGKPVNIRLLDPPLHEFLPTKEQEITELAKNLKMDFKELNNLINNLTESNPMLGHRGCRLGVTFPEIYIMQTKAIINAAIEVKRDLGIQVNPEIMIPLVSIDEELASLRKLVEKASNQLVSSSSIDLNVKIGTMIEIPRACVTADQIAKHADFFSFGTNDLTQMTFGFSRDDVGKFTGEYKRQDIINRDPFEALDQSGVGALMKTAIELGKKTNPEMHLGICGEHGGEPSSIEFCHGIGLDYVSCSPYRIPVARLAAAHSAIRSRKMVKETID